MSLDLFTGNIDDAVNYAARVSAPELPSTFSDNFNDAWNKGYLTSQSISGEIRKTRARSELVDTAIAKTGDQSFGQIERDGFLDPQIFNAKLAEHKAARPDLDVQPISDEAIQARADEIGKAQLATSADFARRERTAGGTFGQLVGAGAAAVADPVNLIAFPLAAPESLGILGTALAWGGIGAGSQTLIEALNATSMERIQPGYGASGQPITNILETGAGGAVLGGAIKGLASAWTRAKTGSWPRTVRDAGNVVESEAQIAGTNPFIPAPSPAQRLVDAAVPLHPDNSIVFVDAAKVDAMLGPMNRTYDPEKRARAKEFIAAQPDTWNPPELNARVNSRNGNDMVDIVDGVHRWAAMRDNNLPVVPVEMNAASIRKARQMGIVTDRPVFQSTDHVAAEAAHRTALNKAIDDLANGRPVDVEGIVTPEQLAALDERAAPVLAAKDAALEAQQAARAAADEVLATSSKPPELPFAQTALEAQAELHTGTLTQGIQDIARLAGHDMPADEAAKIAARISQLNDPDKARAVLDEVFLRPQTIADTLPIATKPATNITENIPAEPAAALRADLTPAKIEEARVHPDMAETVARDLDKLMLERPALEVPTGVTVDAEGRTVPTTRKVEDVVAEADARSAAAKEIEACVGPYPAGEVAA